MATVRYRGLPEFGLPLVTPDDPGFPALVDEMQSRPAPFGSWPAGDLSTAAVLLNQSREAVVILVHVWRYQTAEGKTRTSHHSNFGSSMQTNYLSGRAGVVADLGSFILPGSRRLITEQGVFGNNLDVLPPSERRGGGYCGAAGGRRFRGEEASATELVLDAAVFEDGLCTGPDEFRLFEALTEELERQHRVTQEIVAAVRKGASAGQVFELLRPLARRVPPPALASGRSQVPALFADEAIHHLIHDGEAEWAAWFEQVAQATPVRLHRA